MKTKRMGLEKQFVWPKKVESFLETISPFPNLISSALLRPAITFIRLELMYIGLRQFPLWPATH